MTRRPKKRVSRRVREEAALICSAMANDALGECNLRMQCATASIGAGTGAEVAAVAAWNAAWDAAYAQGRIVARPMNQIEMAEMEAEAEALLRTGWSP